MTPDYAGSGTALDERAFELQRTFAKDVRVVAASRNDHAALERSDDQLRATFGIGALKDVFQPGGQLGEIVRDVDRYLFW